MPINGLSTSQRKLTESPINRAHAEGRAQREFIFAKKREVSAGLVEKLLKLERPLAERFYALYRKPFNPDLTVPDAVVEEWISVGTFRAKEKITATPQQVVEGRLPPAADH